MNCSICTITTDREVCEDCLKVRWLVAQYRPDELLLVVDGAFNDSTRQAGAGLVLARECDEAVLATCVGSFTSTKSTRVELEAIKRGAAWAPGPLVWSDCKSVMTHARQELKISVQFIPEHLRDPLHNLAHRLANVGLTRDPERRERLWIPGEVW
jgi:hypothetical protein